MADRDDRATFANAVNTHRAEWDLTVDCIGMTRAHAEQDVELWSGRTGRLVFISTDFVYDPRNRKIPQTESDAVYTAIGYGGAKREAEMVLIGTDPARLAWTVLRPSHIYGPGSLLGCLPLHSRDPELLGRLQKGEALSLLNGGRLIQHPIFAPDLARTILSVPKASEVSGRIFNVAGPDSAESRLYYEIIADSIGVMLTIKSVDVEEFLKTNPGREPFCCDRVYDLTALTKSGLVVPSTSLRDGLRQHVQALTGIV
jgi:nucleoside-diphosphate-sugar epimerase